MRPKIPTNMRLHNTLYIIYDILFVIFIATEASAGAKYFKGAYEDMGKMSL